jgi:protein-tyrosine phosphatase
MITMITDRIGIGDSSDGRQVPPGIDAVLNVAVDLDIPLTQGNVYRHKVGLLDGPGNDDALLLSAVMVLHALNKRHNRVLVHCHEGKSRSVMVVSAFVAIVGGMEFDKVLKDIMKARGVTDYRPALYAQYQQLIPTLRRLIRP